MLKLFCKNLKNLWNKSGTDGMDLLGNSEGCREANLDSKA